MTLSNKVQQFSDDADALHAIVHGPAAGDGSTVATEGGARRTLAKIDADLQGQGYVQQVLQGATDAQTAKTAAEAARDAANTSGRAYTSAQGTAAALADGAVAIGQSFAVVAADLLSFTVYRKDAGPVATQLFVQHTKAYLDSMLARNTYRSWLHVVTGASGKLAYGVTTAGKFILGVGGDIVARITANETEVAAQKAQFVRSVRGNAYIWMVVDSAKTKIALAVDKAGNLIAKGRDVLAEIDAMKVVQNLSAGMFKADGNAHTARIAWVDANGKAVIKATRKGRVLVWDRDVLNELDALNAASLSLSAPNAAREGANYLVVPFTDGAGKKQLKTIRKSDGRTAAVTAVGNNINPSLTSDGKVLFVSDSTGAWVQSYVPADGGAVYPTFANSSLACWGDSLTAGAGSSNGATKSYPAQLSALLGGRTFFNGGIGGQNSAQIAVRQGGEPTLVTVAGNQIPAAGAVAVTAKSVNILTNSGAFSGTQTGTLAGVPGTISTDAAGNWTFTRTANGSATDCPANTAFVPDLAVAHRGDTAIIVVGRNDSMATTPATHLAVIADMVSYLSPYYKNFLIGSVLNGTTEGAGTGNYTSIKARNDAAQAAYPNNYVDLWTPPTADEMTTIGFVPDSTDLADIANGCIPTHMRNYAAGDTLHGNDFMYALWALRFKNAITAKGW